jgi:hypothetical protein
VDDVEGDQETMSADLLNTDNETMVVGGITGTKGEAGGYFKDFEILDYVMTPEERSQV